MIYEALPPETRPTSDGGPGRAKQTRRQNGDDTGDRFTTATAKAAGKSERNVQRPALRGKKLGEAPLTLSMEGFCHGRAPSTTLYFLE